jgi:hypothetical protein
MLNQLSFEPIAIAPFLISVMGTTTISGEAITARRDDFNLEETAGE